MVALPLIRRRNRRILLQCTIIATAVVLTWFFAARESGDESGATRNSIENASRVITYGLEAERWIEFGLVPGHRSLRLVTTANFDQSRVQDEADPLRANYVIEYITVGAQGDVSEPGYLHETAYLHREQSQMLYLDDRELPASGQVILFDLNARPLRSIRLRLVSSDESLSSVGIRANAEENVNERETGFRWQRLRRDQQAALFRGSVYPPEFARSDERRRLMRTRWVPLGPLGVAGRDYDVKVLYVAGEEEEESDNPLLGSGLLVTQHAHGVVPVPPGGGDITLRLQALGGIEAGIVKLLVSFFPDGLAVEDRFPVRLSRGLGVFRRTLPEGVLVIRSSSPVSVNAELVGGSPFLKERSFKERVSDKPESEVPGSNNRLDITPSPVLTSTWILDRNRPAAWQITALETGRVPVRLDLRVPLFDGRARPPVEVTLDMLGEDGERLATEQLTAVYHWTPYERLTTEDYSGMGAANRTFMILPTGTHRVVASASEPVAINLFTRPPELPYRVRVPTDYSSYPVDPPRPLIWFSLIPEQAEAFILDRHRQFLMVSATPRSPDPDLLSGDFEFVTYNPDGMTLGRDLLIPSTSKSPVNRGTEGGWFRPLLNGRQTIRFLDGNRDSIQASLIWRNAGQQGEQGYTGLISVSISGKEQVNQRVEGRQGVIQLGPIDPGVHEVNVAVSDGLEVYVNHGGKADGTNRVRRFASQLKPGMDPLRYKITKTEATETITLALHRALTAVGQVTLDAVLIGPAPVHDRHLAYTPRRRLFQIEPAREDESAWVIGAKQAVDAGQRFFFPLNEDLPAGDYTLKLDPGRGFDGYLSVYQLKTGNAASESFRLERTDEME